MESQLVTHFELHAPHQVRPPVEVDALCELQVKLTFESYFDQGASAIQKNRPNTMILC